MSRKDTEKQFKRITWKNELHKRLEKPQKKFRRAKKTLEALVMCLQFPLLDHPLIFVGCLEISQIILRSLKKLNFQPKAFVGTVTTFDNKEVAHVWVEVAGYVIEPNPSQMFKEGKPYTVWLMDKFQWERRLHPKVEMPFEKHPQYKPTEAGEKFYSKIADDMYQCVTQIR